MCVPGMERKPGWPELSEQGNEGYHLRSKVGQRTDLTGL